MGYIIAVAVRTDSLSRRCETKDSCEEHRSFHLGRTVINSSVLTKRISMRQLLYLDRFLTKTRQTENSLVIVIALIIALLGLALRITLLFLAGNRQIGPLSGVGDQVRYLTLSDSIFQGRGF